MKNIVNIGKIGKLKKKKTTINNNKHLTNFQ